MTNFRELDVAELGQIQGGEKCVDTGLQVCTKDGKCFEIVLCPVKPPLKA